MLLDHFDYELPIIYRNRSGKDSNRNNKLLINNLNSNFVNYLLDTLLKF